MGYIAPDPSLCEASYHPVLVSWINQPIHDLNEYTVAHLLVLRLDPVP